MYHGVGVEIGPNGAFQRPTGQNLCLFRFNIVRDCRRILLVADSKFCKSCDGFNSISGESIKVTQNNDWRNIRKLFKHPRMVFQFFRLRVDHFRSLLRRTVYSRGMPRLGRLLFYVSYKHAKNVSEKIISREPQVRMGSWSIHTTHVRIFQPHPNHYVI